MIVVNVPYREDANLGRAYNNFIQLLAGDDWAIFLDHDAMPTTGQWFRQFAEAIAFRPNAGVFVAMANRGARSWQCCGDPDNNNIGWHRNFGAQRANSHRTLLDITDTHGWGGVCFALSKAAWKGVDGFTEGAFGCTDHSMHFKLQKTKRRSYLIEGLYVFHWRHYGTADPTASRPKVPRCPCMTRPRIDPTERIRLP